MSLFSAAVSALHLALVPLPHVPTTRSRAPSLPLSPLDVEYPFWHSYYNKCSDRVMALRFGSENDRGGRAFPGFTPVPMWEEHPRAGEVLLERCERLYQAFVVAEEGRAEEEGGKRGTNGEAR